MNRMHAALNVGIDLCYLSLFFNCNQNCNESTKCSKTTPPVNLWKNLFSGSEVVMCGQMGRHMAKLVS